MVIIASSRCANRGEPQVVVMLLATPRPALHKANAAARIQTSELSRAEFKLRPFIKLPALKQLHTRVIKAITSFLHIYIYIYTKKCGEHDALQHLSVFSGVIHE